MKASSKIELIRRPVEKREIPGYEGLYSVTMDGRVWAHRRTILIALPPNSHWSATHRQYRKSPNWLKPVKARDGYLYISLYNYPTSRRYPVHQLVLMAWGPLKPSPNHEVNHRNGNKTDNFILNLEWLLPHENVQHAVKERQKNGVNGAAKLTEADIIEIRRRYADGEQQSALANEYKVRYEAINRIINRRRWRHI